MRERPDLAPVAWHADYLNPEENAEPNQVDKSLQTTRRFDALKLWVTLRALGAGRRSARWWTPSATLPPPSTRTSRPTATSGWWGPPTCPPSCSATSPTASTPSARTRLVPQVRRVLFDSGRALVAKTVIDGRPCLKLTLLNPDATLADIRGVLELVRSAAHGLLAGEALAGTDEPPCRDVHPRLARTDVRGRPPSARAERRED